ncbi:hypothetical protein GCM10017673_18980 [Streptosporangium violaceochromogenes]|nr:hypothetical protein GCM10017673_18980 [Streptosporangium violaceochromogenes]
MTGTTATSGSPAVVLDWLRRARTGGVRRYERGGTVFVPWEQVHADVERVAGHLRRGGVERGDRIGVRAGNGYEWLVLDLALLRLGALLVAVPVPDFKGRPAAEITSRYGIAMMFADRSGRTDGDGSVPLESLLDLPALPPPVRVAPKGRRLPLDDRDYFSVVFSSGTAGRIKCLLMYWPGVHRLIEATIETYAVGADDRIMIALPLSTFQQRYLCYLAIRSECEVVLTTTARYVPALTDCAPTILLGPPTFYEFALIRFENEEAEVRDGLVEMARSTDDRETRRKLFASYHEMFGGNVRLMLVGSAPVRREMLDLFDLAGFELYQIYGMTESGFLAWNRPGANRIGSAGRETYPGTVSVAADGEVLIGHPWHICVGYEGESPDDVAAVFRGGDVIATGDLGEFVDGYLHIRGRKKNVIVTTGGQKIQREDAEAELCRAAGVSQVALLDVPTGQGMAVVAWYQGEEAVARASLRSRVQQLNRRLGPDLRIGGIALVRGDPAQDSTLRNRNLKLNRSAVWAAFERRLETIDG